jgi:hypothetical protein
VIDPKKGKEEEKKADSQIVKDSKYEGVTVVIYGVIQGGLLKENSQTGSECVTNFHKILTNVLRNKEN